MSESPVTIDHFSDILCIWSYVSQVRMDELRQQFPDEVAINYRFIPLFGSTADRIGEGWQDRGGFGGYADHVQEIAAGWDHVEVHRDVWREIAPASSTPAHLFLKAVQLLAEKGEISSEPQLHLGDRSLPEEAAWRLRRRFFAGAEDIARTEVQEAVATELGVPLDSLRTVYDSGTAHAMLHKDLVERDRYQIPGSPTLLMAGGRQRLFGNVGYRIIEANVRELLQNPKSGQASWC